MRCKHCHKRIFSETYFVGQPPIYFHEETGSKYCDTTKAELEEVKAPVLSTGQESTLGNWYGMSKVFFGEDSKATQFIKEKLDKQGAGMPVLSNEAQFIYALVQMDRETERDLEADNG